MDTFFSHEIPDEGAMISLGTRLGGLLDEGDLVLLRGELGMGKSVLARSIIRQSYPEAEAPSPTFTFVETYEGGSRTIFHYDLYRLETPDEVWELGIEEALETGLMLVEWPDRTNALPTEEALHLLIETGESAAARRVTLSGNANWARRLRKAALS